MTNAWIVILPVIFAILILLICKLLCLLCFGGLINICSFFISIFPGSGFCDSFSLLFSSLNSDGYFIGFDSLLLCSSFPLSIARNAASFRYFNIYFVISSVLRNIIKLSKNISNSKWAFSNHLSKFILLMIYFFVPTMHLVVPYSVCISNPYLAFFKIRYNTRVIINFKWSFNSNIFSINCSLPLPLKLGNFFESLMKFNDYSLINTSAIKLITKHIINALLNNTYYNTSIYDCLFFYSFNYHKNNKVLYNSLKQWQFSFLSPRHFKLFLAGFSYVLNDNIFGLFSYISYIPIKYFNLRTLMIEDNRKKVRIIRLSSPILSLINNFVFYRLRKDYLNFLAQHGARCFGLIGVPFIFPFSLSSKKSLLIKLDLLKAFDNVNASIAIDYISSCSSSVSLSTVFLIKRLHSLIDYQYLVQGTSYSVLLCEWYFFLLITTFFTLNQYCAKHSNIISFYVDDLIVCSSLKPSILQSAINDFLRPYKLFCKLDCYENVLNPDNLIRPLFLGHYIRKINLFCLVFISSKNSYVSCHYVFIFDAIKLISISSTVNLIRVFSYYRTGYPLSSSS